MKTPFASLLILAGSAALSAQAAFIIETNGTLGSSNFAFTGDGTSASPSTSSEGLLPAFTDTPQTFFTLGHVFGGNGVTFDQYTFSYSPSADPDNATFAPNTLFNSRGSLADLTSSGLSGGTAGFYNVYRLHQANPGTTAGNTTTYEILVNGSSVLSETIDQNPADFATGRNVGRWELIGNVPLANATDTVSVTMTPNGNPIGFVSMRASGVMFEYVAPIPEPSTSLLATLALVLLARRRRR